MTGPRLEINTASKPLKTALRLGLSLRRISRTFGWPFLLFLLFFPSDRSGLLKNGLFPIFFVFGVLFCLLGAILRFWAKGYASAKDFSLEGPFRHVRNPIQLAHLLFYFGILILFQAPVFYLILILIFAFLWLHLVALSIERDLYLDLGPFFLKYKERVSLWCFSLQPEMNRSGARFSFSRALLPGIWELLWFAGVGVVLALRRRWGM